MEKNYREVIILQRFKTSLIEIWEYIAEDSVKHADKFILDLEKALAKIEEYPESNPMFKPLAGKRRLYRYKIFRKSYLIVYKMLKFKLIFIRIIHSKQNPATFETLRTKDY